MASGDTLLDADGNVYMDADGKERIVGAAASDCECCGESPTCCECFNCCFSDDSVAELTYDIDTITFSLGDDFDDAYLTGTASNVPFSVCGAWVQEDFPINELFGGRECANGAWSIGMPGPGETLKPNAEQGTDAYRLELNVEVVGDCCGASGTANMVIHHYTRESILVEWQEEAVASRTGTGTATITITNNGCCFDGADCQPTTGNCDGECDEELP